MKERLQETTDEALEDRLELAGRKALASVQKSLKSEFRNHLAELDRYQNEDAEVIVTK